MDKDIDLKGIVWLVRRQAGLILTTFAVVIALTFVFTSAIKPRYTATALLLVDTSLKDLLGNDSRRWNPSADNAKVDSEVGILRSDTVFVDVIREQRLVSDPEFAEIAGLLSFLPARAAEPADDYAIGQALAAFKSAVSINRNGMTYLISVGVVSKEPAKAARLANAMADAYIRQQIAAKVSATLAARDSIHNRVTAARQKFVESGTSFDDYVTRYIDRIQQTSPSLAFVALREELERIKVEQSQQMRRVEAIRRSLAIADYRALSAEAGSKTLDQLDKRRKELAARIGTAGGKPNGDLKAAIELVNRSLRTEAAAVMSNLQEAVSVFEGRASAVRERLRAKVMESDLPPRVQAEIYSLQQSSDIARAQYQSLLSKLEELDAQSDLQLPDSRIVSAALVPTIPSFPNTPLNLGIATFCALAIGIAAAVLREYFIGGFTSEGQIETVLKLPLAAISPWQPRGRDTQTAVAHASVADTMLVAPHSLFSESIRRLRLSTEHVRWRKDACPSPDNRQAATIMISSSIASEGKSTIALSLARAYALTGHATLLIDCDLRKPSLYRHLDLKPGDDFFSSLRPGAAPACLSSMIRRDPKSGVDVLIGQRRDDAPVDGLVLSEKIGAILAVARRNFDYVILDTPAIELVVDGLYLARHADMIIFAIKWASTPQSSTRHAIMALQENKAPATGIVAMLTQQERGKASGYSHYHRE